MSIYKIISNLKTIISAFKYEKEIAALKAERTNLIVARTSLTNELQDKKNLLDLKTQELDAAKAALTAIQEKNRQLTEKLATKEAALEERLKLVVNNLNQRKLSHQFVMDDGNKTQQEREVAQQLVDEINTILNQISDLDA